MLKALLRNGCVKSASENEGLGVGQTMAISPTSASRCCAKEDLGAAAAGVGAFVAMFEVDEGRGKG